LAEFTGLPATSHIKSLVVVAGGKPVLALLRGDHQLSEEKLKRVLRVSETRPANAQEIGRLFGAGAGSLGPVGVSGVRILSDQALRGRRNMLAGANKDDYHLRHVTPGEDFEAEFFELRRAADDEELTWLRLGLIAEPNAESRHVGRYGIRIERLLSAAAGQHHDEDGLKLPASIAPFDVIVTPVNIAAEALLKTAVEIAEAAEAAGLEILLDDRDERPGVKFKDADLIGVPWRVVVGKKIGEGLVKVVERESKQRIEVGVSDVLTFLKTRC
jgi:prolyl-tRNA synthetase